jgi:uncharacterized protein
LTNAVDSAEIVAATTAWLEAAVIGLNLCPFAQAPHIAQRIRYAVTPADSAEGLLEALLAELKLLAGADPDEIETTLLIHPRVFGDFLDYNDFLEVADAAVEELQLEGEIQVASFHPRYQFSGTEADDIENFSNRSPYPMLHLLREASIERAVEAHPDIAQIPEKNMRTLRGLGHAGWERLMAGGAPKK